MMARRLLILMLSMSLFCLAGQAQVRNKFLRPDTTLNKAKVATVAGGMTVIYGSALIFLNQYWYKEYPRSRFHFFNDGREWMGMDKGGHVWSSYFESRWGVGMYRWTGMKDKSAIWVGGLTGTILQSSIEVLDGFSEEWGFSGYDFLANMAGSALVISQELVWGEQRITLKMSSHRPKYPADLLGRANDLYGSSPMEVALKDYNALTIWASVNVASFMKKERNFPKWLNIAIGYGANGLYGGFENKWCATGGKLGDCNPADIIDRNDVRRYPQFYLSVDIDLTRIKTRSPFLRSLFNVINIIKIPAPTIEFNPVDKVKFHPLFF